MRRPAALLLAALAAGCADGTPRNSSASVVVAPKGEPVELAATLGGSLESKAAAEAQLLFEPGAKRLTWSVRYVDLSGPPTAAHFHGPARETTGAPVTINLAQGGPAGNPLRGQALLTAKQAEQLLAGDWYLDIHTELFPAGEVRGRVATRR